MSRDINLWGWRDVWEEDPSADYRILLSKSTHSKEQQWLATHFAEPTPDKLALARNIVVEVDVFDIDQDGRSDRTFSLVFPSARDTGGLQVLSAIDDHKRAKGTTLRIVYVGLKDENQFDTKVLDLLGMKLDVEPEFFLDHFLPSLPSDKSIFYNGKPLYLAAPTPSQHRYFRLKDFDGRNTSALFRCDITGQNRIVLILGPLFDEGGHKPSLELWNFGKRPADAPLPMTYNGSEWIFPLAASVARGFISHLQQLSIAGTTATDIASYEDQVREARQRLRYCRHNIWTLGSSKNPDTQKLIDDYDYLLNFACEIATDLHTTNGQRTTKLQQQQSTESLELIKSSAELVELQTLYAEKQVVLADSAQRLAVLAFVFIPLNFVAALFAMHIAPLGFSDNPVPLWHFVVTALAIEVAVFAVWGGVSLVHRVRSSGHGKAPVMPKKSQAVKTLVDASV